MRGVKNVLYCSIAICLEVLFCVRSALAVCESVYVVGLEGVGHHGIGPVLASFLQHAQGKEKARHIQKLKLSNDLSYYENFRKYSESCLNEEKGCVAFSGASFPSSRSPFTNKLKSQSRWIHDSEEQWQYLETVGHPIHIERYFNAGSKFCKVRFILLHRNFVDAVWAHRTWDTGVRGHLKVLGMFARYIDQQLQKIPDYAWKRIDYEDFWSEQRDDVLKDLCKFLEWNVPNVSSTFMESGFRLKITSRARIPCSVVKYIEGEGRSIFRPLHSYSNRTQHLGYGKDLSTYSRDSPKRHPRCFSTHYAQGRESNK